MLRRSRCVQMLLLNTFEPRIVCRGPQPYPLYQAHHRVWRGTQFNAILRPDVKICLAAKYLVRYLEGKCGEMPGDRTMPCGITRRRVQCNLVPKASCQASPILALQNRIVLHPRRTHDEKQDYQQYPLAHRIDTSGPGREEGRHQLTPPSNGGSPLDLRIQEGGQTRDENLNF